MEIRLYRPPSQERPHFEQIEITHSAQSVSYTESFYGFGDFEFTIPTCRAHNFERYLFVLINKEFWGIVLGIDKTIADSGDVTAVSGFALDGFLAMRRITPDAFAGTESGGVAGYDAVTGTTEACMKHYVRKCFFDPLSPSRSVPGFLIAPDLGRGKLDDKYMSRFDPLPTVIEELGRGGNIGYKITPDVPAGNIVFDCIEGSDRTAGQSERPRIVFSPPRKNISDMRAADKAADAKNVFYASLSGSQFAEDTYTATVIRDGEELPSGICRWEQHLDISASHPVPGEELTELRRLALARAETYRPVKSLSAEVYDRGRKYGTDYFLGDTVTVLQEDWGLSMDAQITAMTVTGDEGGVKRTVTFGDAPVNVIQKLKRQIRGG